MFKELRELFKMGGTEKQKKEVPAVTVHVFSVIVESISLQNSIGNQDFQSSEMLPLRIGVCVPLYGGDSTSKISVRRNLP